MELRQKTIIVLEGLFNGQELEVEIVKGCKYKIRIIDDRLVIVALKTSVDKEPEKVYLTCDVTLSDFISMCNELSDDEVVLIAATTTLLKIGKKDGNKN